MKIKLIKNIISFKLIFTVLLTIITFSGILQSFIIQASTPDTLFKRYAIADIIDEISNGVVNINISNDEGTEIRSGSGVIVSKKGYILTNHHVIENTHNITIILANEIIIEEVEIIGKDSLVDIAVLQVNPQKIPEEIPILTMGDSEKVRVGEWVIAIGNPYANQLGSEPTVTVGIISTKNRNIETKDKTYENFLQTDAPINPGNSGGPLVNLDGEIIGINTAIIPYGQGIGFAIPINKAQKIKNKLIKYGNIERPWLGIQIDEPSLLKAEKGAKVKNVINNSPADENNIKKGDLIIQINNQKINNPADYDRIKGTLEIGEEIRIIIKRDGIREYKMLTVEKHPDN